MHDVLWVGQRADHDTHRAVSIAEERPPERRQLAAVCTPVVSLALGVVEDLPAHQLFIVADGCHPEYFLHELILLIVALKLDSFLDHDVPTAGDLRVAVILGLLDLQRAKLEIALLRVPLTKEKLTVTSVVRVCALTAQEGYLGVLKIRVRLFWIQQHLEGIQGRLNYCLGAIERKLGRDVPPKGRVARLAHLKEDLLFFVALNEIPAKIARFCNALGHSGVLQHGIELKHMYLAILAAQQDDPGLSHVLLEQIQVEHPVVGLILHAEVLKWLQKDGTVFASLV